MDYLDMLPIKVVELLKNEKFLRWRLTPDEELNAYWLDLQNQDLDLEANIMLADKYLKEHFFQQRKITAEDKQMLWDRILQTASASVQKSYRIPTFFKYFAAAAFVIIVAGGVWALLKKPVKSEQNEMIVGNQLQSKDVLLITGNGITSFQDNINIKIGEDGNAVIDVAGTNGRNIKIGENASNKLIVPYGRRSGIQLPDGSKIWLNSGSEIEFPTVFGNKERRIKLSGEMYIEVASDKLRPFYVQAADFETEVLGTKFNISAYSKLSKTVTLAEGSVQVKSAGTATRISPGQQAIYYNGQFTKKQVNVQQFTSWKDGYITLNKTPISDVLDYLARYYNLSFDYQAQSRFRNVTCNGKLYLSDNLDNVMNVIALLSSTTYRREGNVIYIK